MNLAPIWTNIEGDHSNAYGCIPFDPNLRKRREELNSPKVTKYSNLCSNNDVLRGTSGKEGAKKSGF